ncbi:MAG: response regulator transcription factor [Bryobacteraceae bacterium]
MPSQNRSPFEPLLSPREWRVLFYVAEGKRNGGVGCILGTSERTVEKHVSYTFKKLGVETRGAAGEWWHRQHYERDKERPGWEMEQTSQRDLGRLGYNRFASISL